MEKRKRSFLFRTLFLSFCITQNSYACLTMWETTQIVVCTLPSTVFFATKCFTDYSSVTSFLATEQDADFIKHGVDIGLHLLTITGSIYLQYDHLWNKKSLFTPSNQELSEIQLENKKLMQDWRISLEEGTYEVILLILWQAGVLWYQQKLNAESMSYAILYSLMNMIPSKTLIFMKKYP
ncbi:MAG TPA: hypothetical protein VL201_02655 [Patescibacteria group bacterium]|jgi:hypothetical protein|nr:hypothetical protein [Patescibacteria group bacterium]